MPQTTWFALQWLTRCLMDRSSMTRLQEGHFWSCRWLGSGLGVTQTLEYLQKYIYHLQWGNIMYIMNILYNIIYDHGLMEQHCEHFEWLTYYTEGHSFCDDHRTSSQMDLILAWFWVTQCKIAGGKEQHRDAIKCPLNTPGCKEACIRHTFLPRGTEFPCTALRFCSEWSSDTVLWGKRAHVCGSRNLPCLCPGLWRFGSPSVSWGSHFLQRNAHD